MKKFWEMSEEMELNPTESTGCPSQAHFSGSWPVRGIMAAGLIAAWMAVPIAPTAAQPAAPQPAASSSVQEAEARATLMRMATFLGSASAFSVTIDSAYDAVQDDGQKVEFGAVRRVLLSRPDFLRIETDNRDGTQRRVFFDGKILTLFSPDAKVYASVARPG